MDYIKELGFIPKILLVEDNPDSRKLYKESLETAGFKVVEACDGSEIESIVDHTFQVILCDTDMPNTNGDVACKRLIEQGRIPESTLILGMSGDASYEEHWNDIAHSSGFLYKGMMNNIGSRVMSHFYNFKTGKSSIWKERMGK